MIKENFQSEDVKYSLRLVLVRIAENLAIFAAKEDIVGMRDLQKTSVDMIIKSSTDKIINVRMACANALTNIMKNGSVS